MTSVATRKVSTHKLHKFVNFRHKLTPFIKTFSEQTTTVVTCRKLICVTSRTRRILLSGVSTLQRANALNDVTNGSYCKYDFFRPTCDDSHVIVIHAARFGRMRVGRCVTSNDVGCQADVTNTLWRECAGARSCEVSGSDQRLLRERPCPADVSEYLEVDYSCREGMHSYKTPYTTTYSTRKMLHSDKSAL